MSNTFTQARDEAPAAGTDEHGENGPGPSEQHNAAQPIPQSESHSPCAPRNMTRAEFDYKRMCSEIDELERRNIEVRRMAAGLNARHAENRESAENSNREVNERMARLNAVPSEIGGSWGSYAQLAAHSTSQTSPQTNTELEATNLQTVSSRSSSLGPTLNDHKIDHQNTQLATVSTIPQSAASSELNTQIDTTQASTMKSRSAQASRQNPDTSNIIEDKFNGLSEDCQIRVKSFLNNFAMDDFVVKRIKSGVFEIEWTRAAQPTIESQNHASSNSANVITIQEIVTSGSPDFESEPEKVDKDKFTIIHHTVPANLKPLEWKKSEKSDRKWTKLDELIHCPDPEEFPLQNQTWRIYHDRRRQDLLLQYLSIYKTNQGTHLANAAEFALYMFDQGRPMRIWNANGHGAEQMGFEKGYKSILGGCMYTPEEADIFAFTEAEHVLWASCGHPPHNVLIIDESFNKRRPAKSFATWTAEQMRKGKSKDIWIDIQRLERSIEKQAAVPMLLSDALRLLEKSRNDRPVTLKNPPLNLLNLTDTSRGHWPEGLLKHFTLWDEVVQDIETKVYSDMRDITGKAAMGKPSSVIKHNSDMKACGQFRIAGGRGAVSRWHVDQCGVYTFTHLEGNTDDPNEKDEDVVKYWPSIPMKNLSPNQQKKAIREYAQMGETWRPTFQGGIPVLTILKGQMLIQAPGNIHGPITLTDCFFIGGMAWKASHLKDHLKAWKFSAVYAAWVSNEDVPRQSQEFLLNLKLLVEADPTTYGYNSNSAEDLADFYQTLKMIYSRASVCECQGPCSKDPQCECRIKNVHCGMLCKNTYHMKKVFEMGKPCTQWSIGERDPNEAPKSKKKKPQKKRIEQLAPHSNGHESPEPERSPQPQPEPRAGDKRRRRADSQSQGSDFEDAAAPKKRRLMSRRDKKLLEQLKATPAPDNFEVGGPVPQRALQPVSESQSHGPNVEDSSAPERNGNVNGRQKKIPAHGIVILDELVSDSERAPEPVHISKQDEKKRTPTDSKSEESDFQPRATKRRRPDDDNAAAADDTQHRSRRQRRDESQQPALEPKSQSSMNLIHEPCAACNRSNINTRYKGPGPCKLCSTCNKKWKSSGSPEVWGSANAAGAPTGKAPIAKASTATASESKATSPPETASVSSSATSSRPAPPSVPHPQHSTGNIPAPNPFRQSRPLGEAMASKSQAAKKVDRSEELGHSLAVEPLPAGSPRPPASHHGSPGLVAAPTSGVATAPSTTAIISSRSSSVLSSAPATPAINSSRVGSVLLSAPPAQVFGSDFPSAPLMERRERPAPLASRPPSENFFASLDPIPKHKNPQPRKASCAQCGATEPGFRGWTPKLIGYQEEEICSECANVPPPSYASVLGLSSVLSHESAPPRPELFEPLTVPATTRDRSSSGGSVLDVTATPAGKKVVAAKPTAIEVVEPKPAANEAAPPKPKIFLKLKAKISMPAPTVEPSAPVARRSATPSAKAATSRVKNTKVKKENPQSTRSSHRGKPGAAKLAELDLWARGTKAKEQPPGLMVSDATVVKGKRIEQSPALAPVKIADSPGGGALSELGGESRGAVAKEQPPPMMVSDATVVKEKRVERLHAPITFAESDSELSELDEERLNM